MSERKDDADRISLDGLTPEEALRALLAIKPETDAPDDGSEDAPDK